jgi:hypothetical protein
MDKWMTGTMSLMKAWTSEAEGRKAVARQSSVSVGGPAGGRGAANVTGGSGGGGGSSYSAEWDRGFAAGLEHAVKGLAALRESLSHD